MLFQKYTMYIFKLAAIYSHNALKKGKEVKIVSLKTAT